MLLRYGFTYMLLTYNYDVNDTVTSEPRPTRF